MKGDDCRNASLVRFEGAPERGRRHDADVAVRDVDVFVGDCPAHGTNAGASDEKSEIRCARRVDPSNGNAVDFAGARSCRDDHDVVATCAKADREVAKMQLDSADARMKPVADESELQAGSGKGKVRPEYESSDIVRVTRSKAVSTRSIWSLECSDDIDTRRRQA